ncbi:PREDICTED: adenylate cyclase type 3-like, partial [Lepidothrix coronata]|uniref:Adenylate cyclase type 3-like n=1 Tax=Lepidothrix coronata TaxID=321398 RepID=A0A6J0J8K1_9PASS
MPRTGGFSEPEFSADYSADYSASLPSDPERAADAAGSSRRGTFRISPPCPCLPRSARLAFAPESLENLYQAYFRRQRHDTLLVLAVFAALFDTYVLATVSWDVGRDGREFPPVLVPAAAFLLAHGALLALWKCRLLPERFSRRFLPGILWILIPAQVLGYLALNFGSAPEPADTVGWQAFFVFSFFLTLPLRLLPIVAVAAASCGLHTLVLGVAVAQQQRRRNSLSSLERGGDLGRQLLSNVALYACAITVGSMSYHMADRKHRKAFLEARQSLEVKLNLEEQSQQQVGKGAGNEAGMSRREVGGGRFGDFGVFQ